MTTRTNRNRPSLLLAALLAGAALLGPAGCGHDDDPLEIGELSARRATQWSELIGGPDAYGMPGDFLLENDKIRLVIQEATPGRGIGIYGGGILDADRVRTFRESCCGKGNDLFQLFTPFVNVMVPAATEGQPPPVSVAVVRDGSDGKEARIRVEGQAAPMLSLLGTQVNDILAQAEYQFQIDYILRPGADYVQVRTTIGVNQEPGADPIETESLTTKEAVLLGLLNGNLLLGDNLVLGSSVTAFGPPFGFYLDGILWEMFMQDPPSSSLSDPIVTDFIAGVGKGMSYGAVAADGNLQLPLFSPSISIMATSKFVQPDHPIGDRNRMTIYFDNYFIVGEGDAASVLDAVYRIRGTPTAPLLGHVVDADSRLGLSHVSVFVFKDPGAGPDPGHPWPELNANWYGPANPDHRAVTLDNLIYAVSQSNVKDPEGSPPKQRVSPLLSQIETDRFEDLTPDGSFHCRLEPGPYLLVAHHEDRPEGNLVPITVRAGQVNRARLALSSPGAVFYRITDSTGNQTPGKITFRGLPIDPGSEACRQNLLGPACKRYGDLQPFLGDPFNPNRVAKVDFSPTGTGTVYLRPGAYEWWMTRGPEYTYAHGFVTVDPLLEQEIRGQIARAVDTTGYLSLDIHQHHQISFDSGIPVMERLKTNVAEHVEILNATDHNYIMNYWPYIQELGVESYLSTIISDELTTFESGHYIGFPLKWDPFLPGNGAPTWQDRTMPQIFDVLRNGAGYGRGRTVVHVPHPRDSLFGLFYLFSLDPARLEPGWASLFHISPDILSILNPVISPVSDGDPATVAEYFSLDFESMELLNAKRFELIRTPTASEYENICQMSDMNPSGGFGDERDCLLNGKATVYDIMKRTFPEQQAIFDGTDPLSDGYMQILDDWFAYLNFGVNITGTAGSDSHTRISVEAGCPRTYLRYSSDSPLNVTDQETAQRVFRHEAVATYGPFLEFWVNDGAAIGSTTVDTDGEVRLRIRAQTAGWFNVDRIEIYGNGFLVGDIGEDATPWDGVDAHQPMPGPHPVRCVTAGLDTRKGAVVAFDREVTCKLAPDPADPAKFQDTWFAVIAMGDATPERSMFPVFTSNDYPYIQIGGMIFLALESLASIDEPIHNPDPLVNALLQLVKLILPLLKDVLTSANPYTIFPVRPWAATNPIWVDADGGGFEPSREIVVNYTSSAKRQATEALQEELPDLKNPEYLKFLRSLFMARHPPPPRYGPLPGPVTAKGP